MTAPRQKECRKCHRVLSSDEFHLDAKAPDGLHRVCISCRKSDWPVSKARAQSAELWPVMESWRRLYEP